MQLVLMWACLWIAAAFCHDLSSCPQRSFSQARRQTLILILTVLTLVFLSAGLVQMVEVKATSPADTHVAKGRSAGPRILTCRGYRHCTSKLAFLQ